MSNIPKAHTSRVLSLGICLWADPLGRAADNGASSHRAGT